MIRALFYRGRHFRHTTDGEPRTVGQIAARIRREALGRLVIRINPDVRHFGTAIHRQLEAMRAGGAR